MILYKPDKELLEWLDKAKQGNLEAIAYLTSKYSLRVYTTQELVFINSMVLAGHSISESINLLKDKG